MHILVSLTAPCLITVHSLTKSPQLTNDDGPPNPEASPYIAIFVDVLQNPPFNHTVSVVLPSTQRSWIGKAHLLPPAAYPLPGQQQPSTNEKIADTCTPTYYDPKQGDVHDRPPASGEYWVLVPGTPATCVQLGLFHHEALFRRGAKQPIDLVLSGPNYGRNTTAAFALSSGTIGGALEAAVCGVRAVALSFAFFTRQESEALVREASVHSVKILEKLCKDWKIPVPNGDSRLADGQRISAASMTPDLFTINVPLVENVSKNPVRWTWMLDNKWPTGSLYKPVEESEDAAQKPPSFTWSPTFTDMWKIVDASPEGNDGLVIRQGHSSITPIKAGFQGLSGQGSFSGEFKL